MESIDVKLSLILGNVRKALNESNLDLGRFFESKKITQETVLKYWLVISKATKHLKKSLPQLTHRYKSLKSIICLTYLTVISKIWLNFQSLETLLKTLTFPLSSSLWEERKRKKQSYRHKISQMQSKMF